MAVECPASGCDYAGHMDAVEGHIGGVNDALHQAVVKSDLRKSLDGKASTGAFWTPYRVVGVVLLGVLVWTVISGGREDGGSAVEEEQDGA